MSREGFRGKGLDCWQLALQELVFGRALVSLERARFMHEDDLPQRQWFFVHLPL